MDPEELESIPLDDGADLESIPMDEGRPARTRRMVLGTTTITAGEPTRYDPRGERVETGHVVDADAPIADVPTSQKPAPTGPTAQQRDWWEDRETDRELSRTSATGDVARTILGLLPGARRTPEAVAAPIRLAQRGQRMAEQWVETVGNEARPPDESSGRDRRGEAMGAGIADALSLGHADEIRGLVRSEPNPDSYRRERDRARAEMADTQRQAPGLFAAGEAVGTLPLLAAPNPATAGGRVLMGAAMGGLGASGHSEADVGTSDFAGDVALGAGLGAAASGTAELANPAIRQRLAGWARGGAESAERLGTQARLEASGVWGGRAMREVDRMEGGAPALAADLRRYGIGERGRASVPVSTRAIEDVERLGETAVDTMGELARRGDAAGARVPVPSLLDDVERIAGENERLGTRTAADASRRLRDEFAGFAGSYDRNISEAWELRRHLDDQARWGAQTGDGSYVALVREARRALDRRMDEAMQAVPDGDLLTQWNDASRRAQIGAVMDRFGRGAERLSTGGGIAGASGSGDVIAEAVQGRNPAGLLPAMAQQGLVRGLSQYARLRQPGIVARGAEGTSGALRGIEGRLRSGGGGAAIPVALSGGTQSLPARRILDTMGRVGAARGGGEVGEGRSEARSSQDAGAWLSETLRTNPQALGQYAEHFADADPQEAARIHFQLSQSDPGYRAQIARARAEER